MLVQKTVPSPVGALTLVADDHALVGLYFERHHPAPRHAGEAVDAHPVLDAAEAQLAAWFAGERSDFDVPVALGATDFQGRVWNALLDIPYGETRTYTDVADAIGRPDAVRAVAGAIACNPLSIVVPWVTAIVISGLLRSSQVSTFMSSATITASA